jgi:hypothetical protein
LLRFKLLLGFFSISLDYHSIDRITEKYKSQETHHLSCENLMGEKTQQKLP